MALRAQAMPAWLGVDAPSQDVVLSSRVRVMRNLRDYPFPAAATDADLAAVVKQVQSAVKRSGLELWGEKGLTNAERDYLVSCRLISPDFRWRELGRAVFLDPAKRVSLMVNEEDHLRIQALTAGWSLPSADLAARALLDALSPHLEFARDAEWGYLAAGPLNCGTGRRFSAMMHLVALAQSPRWREVLAAMLSHGFTARGLFGEASRAVGAFFQVSSTHGDRSAFIGACDYLIEQERAARQEATIEDVAAKTAAAVRYVFQSPSLSLADALRVVSWVRWTASLGLPPFVGKVREVDRWFALLEVRTVSDRDADARARADFLRARFDELGVASSTLLTWS